MRTVDLLQLGDLSLFTISLSGNKPILLLNRQHITRFEFRKELRRRLNGKMAPHVSYKIYFLYYTYYTPGILPCKLRVLLLTEVTEIRIPPLLIVDIPSILANSLSELARSLFGYT
jgi:hypothetical protein